MEKYNLTRDEVNELCQDFTYNEWLKIRNFIFRDKEDRSVFRDITSKIITKYFEEEIIESVAERVIDERDTPFYLIDNPSSFDAYSPDNLRDDLRKAWKEMKIVEVGSGLGEFSDMLKSLKGKILQIDSEEAYCKFNRIVHAKVPDRHKPKIRCANGLHRLWSDSVDVVTGLCSFDVIPDTPKIVRDIDRVLKPGGSFLTFHDNPPYDLFYHGARRDDEIIFPYFSINMEYKLQERNGFHYIKYSQIDELKSRLDNLLDDEQVIETIKRKIDTANAKTNVNKLIDAIEYLCNYNPDKVKGLLYNESYYPYLTLMSHAANNEKDGQLGICVDTVDDYVESLEIMFNELGYEFYKGYIYEEGLIPEDGSGVTRRHQDVFFTGTYNDPGMKSDAPEGYIPISKTMLGAFAHKSEDSEPYSRQNDCLSKLYKIADKSDNFRLSRLKEMRC